MGAMLLPVTLFTAGGAALIALWLGIRTGAVRRGARISIGDGGDARLIARMRAQANFGEYVPYILVLIAVIELGSGTSAWLWAAGVLLLVARVLHALGMDGVRNGRAIGIAITFLLLLGLGGYAIVLPFIANHAARTIEVAPLPAQG